MDTQKAIEMIWKLKDTKECFENQIDELERYILSISNPLNVSDQTMMRTGGYIYYVVDHDTFTRAKVGMTHNDKDMLQRRYKTYTGDLDIIRFKAVTNCEDAERVLLANLFREGLMWSQTENRQNAGVELIRNTTRSLEVFDAVVEMFSC